MDALIADIFRHLPGYLWVNGSASSVGEAKAVPDMTFSHATYVPSAASIKRLVSVPVITAGWVTHPMEAEQVVSNEQADSENVRTVHSSRRGVRTHERRMSNWGGWFGSTFHCISN